MRCCATWRPRCCVTRPSAPRCPRPRNCGGWSNRSSRWPRWIRSQASHCLLTAARCRSRDQAVHRPRPALQGACRRLHPHPAHGAASRGLGTDGIDATGGWPRGHCRAEEKGAKKKAKAKAAPKPRLRRRRKRPRRPDSVLSVRSKWKPESRGFCVSGGAIPAQTGHAWHGIRLREAWRHRHRHAPALRVEVAGAHDLAAVVTTQAGQRSCRLSLIAVLARHRRAVHLAAEPIVIVEGLVHAGAVVPQRQRARSQRNRQVKAVGSGARTACAASGRPRRRSCPRCRCRRKDRYRVTVRRCADACAAADARAPHLGLQSSCSSASERVAAMRPTGLSRTSAFACAEAITSRIESARADRQTCCALSRPTYARPGPRSPRWCRRHTAEFPRHAGW